MHVKPNSKGDYIIIKTFSFTAPGKIRWWEDHRSQLERNYGVPIDKPEFTISLWAGEYQKDSGTDQDSDLLCFEDMKSDKNCIKKGNQPLTIWYNEHSNETIYFVNEWKNKYINDNATGSVRKIR